MSGRVGAEITAALALLTRIPVGAQSSDTGGAAAFGLVGALVGTLGSVAILLVGDAAPLAAGGIALAMMALVSGGLHLDGLADTFDALAAPSREAAESARTDPRVGAAGAAAIAIMIVVDAALLAALMAGAGILIAALACITAASASRAVAARLLAARPSPRRGRRGPARGRHRDRVRAHPRRDRPGHMTRRLILVLGGTRSGKSRFGLERARTLAGSEPVAFLATARPGDPELERRIESHRRARPASWPTIEVGVDLADTIREAPDDRTILLDGLTLWLSFAFEASQSDIDAFIAGPVAEALQAIDRHAGAVVVVSDEIGLGMVPMDSAAREFRDLIGLVHQRFAAEAHEGYLMAAGLSVTLKPR